MLGKLIKNEFVQRGRQTGLLLLGELSLGVIIAIFNVIYKHADNESILHTLCIFVRAAMYVTMFAGMVGVILLILGDFSKRLFKDQGYLTHTLPVKPSSIMLSRIVCDIVIILAMLIVFPLSLSIAAGNLYFFREIPEAIKNMCEVSGIDFNIGSFTALTIVTLICIFISGLVSIWHFNAAYAIGHSFGNGKRTFSVISYIVLYVIGCFSLYVLTAILDSMEFMEAFDPILKSDFSIYIFSMSFVSIVGAIAVSILVAITSFVCKRHLNLE